MSIFAEIFVLMIGASALGTLLGWLLHGRCDNASYHDSDEKVQS